MKKRISILLALVMLLSLCACGSSAAQTEASMDIAPMEAPRSVMASSNESASAAAAGGFAAYDDAMPVPEPEEAPAGADVPDVDPEKIIYSADATVETTEFDSTLEKVADMIKRYNGWIESSSVNGANYYSTARGNVSSRSAYYTLRVPSTSFNEIMTGLSTLGNVPYTHTYTENVTSQYYDTQARLTAYQTQEARLLEMMEKAETVEDIITIEEKLTDLRYRIESLQSTLKNWDRQVSYSTISLDVEEVQEYTPETPAAKASYGQRMWSALKSSLRDIGTFFSGFLIWLVAALPVLALLAVCVYVLVVIIRLCRRKRAARRAAKSAPSGDTPGSGK